MRQRKKTIDRIRSPPELIPLAFGGLFILMVMRCNRGSTDWPSFVRSLSFLVPDLSLHRHMCLRKAVMPQNLIHSLHFLIVCFIHL